MLLLAAALLAILAAASPARRSRTATITLVIDCRLPMSAPGRVRSALTPLHLTSSDTINVIPIPGKPFRTAGDENFTRLRFTADPNNERLVETVHGALARTTRAVYVATDAPLPVADPRVVRLSPTLPLIDIGIDHFAITDGPPPQAMVRVVNHSTQHTATLIVDQTSVPIELPARGNSRNYFVTLPHVGDIATARIDVADDIVADDFAYLVRGHAGDVISVQAPISDALARMIDVYARHRRVGPGHGSILVVSDATQTQGPAVVVPPGELRALPADAKLSVDASSPVTRDVDWNAVAVVARVATLPAGAWRPVVSSGGRPLVAVRDSPRAVWIAIYDAEWSKRADYVIFWTNVFDWIGGGSAGFEASAVPAAIDHPVPVQQADPRVIDSPGIYRDASGQLRATSIRVPTAITAPSPASMQPDRENAVDLIPLAPLLLLAAAGLCAAALGLCHP